MVGEVIKYLNPRPGDAILDCTIGAGGHSKEILKRIAPGGKLIGIDTDAEILEIAKKELDGFQGSFVLRHSNFRDLDRVLADLNISKINGLLFDLGVSSYQLESSQRGFSFNIDGPLDMRMGTGGKAAYELVNYLGKEDLTDIFFKFGEERFARRIAEAITRERRPRSIKTSGELKNIILKAMPKNRKWQKIHPATRVFQALRIVVNDELGALQEALRKAPDVLTLDARICVISFHSLEDRIVKNIFKEFQKEGKIKILTKKPIEPGDIEVEKNPRARSAKLRAAVKL
jgi:16S rRNA (cytosine1402-N4)-methyltransferase